VSVELELKDLILSKYKSLREFAIKIDMPYSTIDTILKRGVDKANINNIIRICKELEIDTEALGEGRIEFKQNENEIHTIAAHHDGEEWTEEELEDIENFKKYVLSKRNNKK
jgi:predicted transcriptional regulator